MRRFWLILPLFSLLFSPLAVRAETVFEPGFILSDRDLTDVSVPEGYSQRFLEARGGAIASMRFPDIDGTMRKPGDLIDYYGKIFGVNPRFLLALIQKEQGLVYDKDPSKCQIDWATGYGRPDGSTCDDPYWQRYRGFTTQIVSAAAFIQCFYQDTTDKCGSRRSFGYQPGVATVIDGQAVVPANLATAALYTYTPHVHGNRNLLRLWSDWFAFGYPDGSYLSTPDGTVWLIQAGLKRRFANKSALHSRVDAGRVIPVGYDVLERYEEGAPIKFAEYALVRVPETGTVYLLTGDRKRPIESMQVFRSIGFNPEEIDDVDPADLAAYADGDPIGVRSSYPTGALLQDNRSGGVYWVEDGVKKPIYSAEIMKTNFPGKKITAVSRTILDGFPTGEPVRFRDGELVTSPKHKPTVFVISNGQRRPISSGEVFERLGYSWKRIIRTNDAALDIHPLGEAVSAPAEEFQAAAAR